jgi:hypothetical protein
MSLPISFGLFVLAGLCEIGGGYLVWLWFREGRLLSYSFAGASILMLYASFQHFRRPTLVESMPPMAACSLYCRSSGDGRWMARDRIGSTL